MVSLPRALSQISITIEGQFTVVSLLSLCIYQGKGGRPGLERETAFFGFLSRGYFVVWLLGLDRGAADGFGRGAVDPISMRAFSILIPV